jgi:trehalose/maltose hydrolase-like predicted phosphorylase
MPANRSLLPVRTPSFRTGPPRHPRLLAALLACAMAATIVTGVGSTTAAAGPARTSSAAALDVSSCPGGGSDAGWTLSTTTFDPVFYRHAFVGNGYVAQRVPPTGMGYVATAEKTGWPLYTPRYDGAFVGGLYAQDPQLAGGRQVIAAIPTWSTLTVGTGTETYTATTPAARISNYHQALLLRCGLLSTALTWTTSDGKSTDLAYDVIADRVHPHVGAVRLRMTPHWNGRATVNDLIDGAGARRLVQTGGGAQGDATVDVAFSTETTATAGAVASTLKPGAGVAVSSAKRSVGDGNLSASQQLTFTVHSGQSYEFVKYVGIDTALTSAEPEKSAVATSQDAAQQGWSGLLSGHAAAWADLWRSDIVLPDRPDLQAWIRSGLYGLLSNIRQDEDDSISPVGLTSDNYAGLIFWDAETWMYPGLLLLHPEIAKSIVEYRYRTLPGARANAQQLGYQGVFYPWNSASKGDLATECHSVDPPHCITQIHLQGDIGLALWQYYLATRDTAWLRSHGWPMLQGIAQFWAGRVTLNSDGSYSINNVAGPDEYSNGVNDGVYTNAVAATALRDATQAAQVLGEPAPAQWTTIADHLRMPFDSQRQVFLQYDGYNGSLIKQADTVLLLYPVEWPMPAQVAASTLDFYAERTDPDGPAMTDSVHAVDAAEIGEPGCATHTYLMRAIKPFVRDPFAQFAEARGSKPGAQDPLAGAPAFNFLTGEGGFTQVFTNGLTGLRWRADRVHLDPMLPPQLKSGVTLKGLHWQGRTFDVSVGPDNTTVSETAGPPFAVESPQGTQMVSSGSPLTLKTRRPDLVPTDNVARCQLTQASSEEPGMYSEAAVDGSVATIWAPDDASGSIRVDLGRKILISRITPHWTDALPDTYQILTSTDGTRWTPVATADPDGTLQHPVNARYVRVDLAGAASGARTGIRELEVIRAAS